MADHVSDGRLNASRKNVDVKFSFSEILSVNFVVVN